MKKRTFVVIAGIAALLAGCSAGGDKPSGPCVDASAALETWMTDHSNDSVGNLDAIYQVESVHAVCGDVIVETRLEERDPHFFVAEAACKVLSTAVGDAPGVESVTVRYVTGNDACTKWPGGESNFG